MVTGVAFGGLAGAGKTFFADAVCASMGLTRVSFAQALRDMSAQMYPQITREQWASKAALLPSPVRWTAGLSRALSEQYGIKGVPEIDVRLHTTREILQFIGTDIVRAADEGYWARELSRRVRACHGRVVIDDVRFMNEVATSRSLGLLDCYIERVPSTRRMSHASEQLQADAFSVVVPNYGDAESVTAMLEVLTHEMSAR